MNYKLKKIILFPMNLLYKINPLLEIKIMFYLKNGYKLNLMKPVTFNEKLQWIKFHDKNEKMPSCSDKYAVRKYIKECGCEEILNHLLWEGYKANEIPFASLPNQFAIKATHGSGFNIICKDKSKLKEKVVKKQMSSWLKEKYIPCYGEWFYGIVKPRIIIEEYLGDKDGRIPFDYKFLCFNGEPRLIQVHTGRFANHKIKLYDLEWNEKVNCKMKYSSDSGVFIKKPKELLELIEYAKILSKPFHFARVDFYIVKGKIYFGEITFTDGAGFDKIYPYVFDVELGSYLKVP
jgi:hypothetical protein